MSMSSPKFVRGKFPRRMSSGTFHAEKAFEQNDAMRPSRAMSACVLMRELSG